MGYSQDYGWWNHLEGGHGILYGDSIKAAAKVLIQDPCHFGQPRILTVAHIGKHKESQQFGSVAQDKGDSRNHGVCRMLVIMWPLGPLIKRIPPEAPQSSNCS